MTYINWHPGGGLMSDGAGGNDATPRLPDDIPDIFADPNGWVRAVRMRDIEETWSNVMHPAAWAEAQREIRYERHLAALRRRKQRNI